MPSPGREPGPIFFLADLEEDAAFTNKGNLHVRDSAALEDGTCRAATVDESPMAGICIRVGRLHAAAIENVGADIVCADHANKRTWSLANWSDVREHLDASEYAVLIGELEGMVGPVREATHGEVTELHGA